MCYCEDCQAYARFLGRDDLMDSHGGTQVIQAWPAQIRLLEGVDSLRLLRLSPKGLHRWYAGCCRTPIGNSFGDARLPFVGLVRRMIAVDDAELDTLFGPARGVQGRFARGACPPGVHPSASLGIISDAMGILLRGVWKGAQRPSPFFDASGRPAVDAQVLSVQERDALR